MTNGTPQYAMGFDFGNEDAIGMVYKRGIPTFLSIPSMTIEGSWEEYQRKQGGSSKGKSTQSGQMAHEGKFVLEHNNIEVFLGSLAMNSRHAVVTRNDVTRYWSIRAVEFLLALSGTLIPDTEYTVHVVTGLPVDGATEENKRQVIHRLENGQLPYSFKLNNRQRWCSVKVHKVMMEGAGALFSQGTEEICTKGVIDIGGRTTNLFVVDTDDTVDYDRTKMATIGVARIGDIANERFRKEVGFELVPGVMRQSIRAYIGKDSWPADIARDPKQHKLLYDAIHGAYLIVSNDINSFIGKTWYTSERGNTAADIPEVHLVGGGAYYFGEYIRRKIEHVVVHEEQPECANVVGYAALAQDYLEEEMSQDRRMAI